MDKKNKVLGASKTEAWADVKYRKKIRKYLFLLKRP